MAPHSNQLFRLSSASPEASLRQITPLPIPRQFESNFETKQQQAKTCVLSQWHASTDSAYATIAQNTVVISQCWIPCLENVMLVNPDKRSYT